MMSTLLSGWESRKITDHVHRKINTTVSKMLSIITGRSIAEETRIPTENNLMNMGDR